MEAHTRPSLLAEQNRGRLPHNRRKAQQMLGAPGLHLVYDRLVGALQQL